MPQAKASAFDPTSFLAATTSEAGSTRLDPIPMGEYAAVIDNLEWREAETKNGTRKIMRVIWRITDDDLRVQLDRDNINVRQDIWLDETRDGQLDYSKGKNIGIGRLREALGQNQPGAPWTLNMLVGAGPALITVTERPADSGDVVYNDVKSVGRMS